MTHQAEDTARTKEKGRRKLHESTGKGLGVAGAANVDRSSPVLRGCLLALCTNSNTGINQEVVIIIHPFFPTCFLSCSLHSSASLWGMG